MKSPSPCRSSLQKIEAESLPRFLFTNRLATHASYLYRPGKPAHLPIRFFPGKGRNDALYAEKYQIYRYQIADGTDGQEREHGAKEHHKAQNQAQNVEKQGEIIVKRVADQPDQIHPG